MEQPMRPYITKGNGFSQTMEIGDPWLFEYNTLNKVQVILFVKLGCEDSLGNMELRILFCTRFGEFQVF